MQQFHSIVWKEDDWFVAKTLEIEVASQGKTEKDALANLKEAVELYLEDNGDVEIASVKEPKLQDINIQVNA